MIPVYTRHNPDCKYASDKQCRRCNCPKWIWGSLAGKFLRRSAKTHSWEQADEFRLRMQKSAARSCDKTPDETTELAHLTEPAPRPTTSIQVLPPAPQKPRVTIERSVEAYLADARSREFEIATLSKLDTIFRKQFLAWTKVQGSNIRAARVSVPYELMPYEQSVVESRMASVHYGGVEYKLVGASGSAKDCKFYFVDKAHASLIAERFQHWPEAAIVYFAILVTSPGAYRQAVEIFRELARIAPAAFEPDLAVSLVNLGSDYFKDGKRKEGEACLREALDLEVKLSQSSLEAFGQRVVWTATILAGNFIQAKDFEHAEPLFRQSSEMARRLVSLKASYRPLLAQQLQALGLIYVQSSQPDKVAPVLDEAIQIHKDLAASDPVGYGDSLASDYYLSSQWLETKDPTHACTFLGLAADAAHNPMMKLGFQTVFQDCSKNKEAPRPR